MIPAGVVTTWIIDLRPAGAGGTGRDQQLMKTEDVARLESASDGPGANASTSAVVRHLLKIHAMSATILAASAACWPNRPHAG